MATLATTKMSAKGQVVIPENVRRRLGLQPGAQFVVIGNKDVVILKVIAPPSMGEFNQIIAEARKAARRAKLKRTDIARAVGSTRGRQ